MLESARLGRLPEDCDLTSEPKTLFERHHAESRIRGESCHGFIGEEEQML